LLLKFRSATRLFVGDNDLNHYIDKSIAISIFKFRSAFDPGGRVRSVEGLGLVEPPFRQNNPLLVAVNPCGAVFAVEFAVAAPPFGDDDSVREAL
jgi:hypothetical protein